MMLEGVDYGLIPGCNKPSLYKSGAEKLCDIFGLSKLIEVINRTEDWSKGLFSYEIKATLINKKTGLVEAEGIGSCNSLEKKYKNQDGFTIANTILKIAKKRALVDAVLSSTRTSGLFTQDMEDISGADVLKEVARNTKLAPISTPTATTSTPTVTTTVAPTVTSTDYPVMHSQLMEIFQLTAKLVISVPDIKEILLEMYNVQRSRDLTTTQAKELIAYLKIAIEAREATHRK